MKDLWASMMVILAVIAPIPVSAETDRGFLTAGGAGAWQCFKFNNDMTTARQGVGITGNEPGTVNSVLMNWVQYVNGYITAYNSLAPQIYDVASTLRPSVGINALMIIEPYCLANPTSQFDLAVFHLIDVLLPSAVR